MLNRKIITLALLTGILFGQSTMNGYGYGMFSHNNDSSSLGSGSIGLLPTFQNNVSLSCLLYTSPSPRDGLLSRMPSSA